MYYFENVNSTETAAEFYYDKFPLDIKIITMPS